MPVGRMVLVVVAWMVAAILAAVPVTAADGRPALEVSPTRALDLDLAPGQTTESALGVRNRADDATRVRLELGDLDRPSRPVTVTVTRDDVIVWTGRVRALREDPVLPGLLAPGESWDLAVSASATAVPGEVEVLGAQASRRGVPDVTSPRAGERGDDEAVLSAGPLDTERPDISLRVQLVCFLLLAAGVLWMAAAFRRDGRRPHTR